MIWRLNQLEMLFTLVALLLFTGTSWTLAKDGVLDFYDGLVLAGDGHICIPLRTPSFFQIGIYVIAAAAVLHFLAIAILKRLPQVLRRC